MGNGNDWADYIKAHKTAGETFSDNKRPHIVEFALFKVINNGLASSVFALTIFFSTVGIFSNRPADATNFALHAAELSLGVFLGLLAKRRA